MAYDIKETFIGTSDPPSICKGKALFPPFPDVGAGVSTNDVDKDVINKKPHVLVTRGVFSVGYGIYFGFCGPGWALASTVDGRVDGRDLTLNVSDWHLQAGVFLGFDVTFRFQAKAQVWKLHWSTVFDLHAEFTFDMIRVISDVIRAVFNEGKIALLTKVQSFAPDLKSSWGMVGENVADHVSSGSFSAVPSFNLPVNMWPLLIQLGDELGVGEILTAINRAFQVTGSSLSFGPELGFELPTTFAWTAVELDGKRFDWDNHIKNGQWKGRADSDLGGQPDRMTIHVQHDTYIDFTLGMFGKLQILEVFHIGAAAAWPILSTLGVRPGLGRYHQTLSQDVGDVNAMKTGAADQNAVGVEFV